jgi:hypothetical protein
VAEDPTLAPEDQGIVSGFEEEGIGGAVRGAASMLLPQAGLPGQRGLGDILREFVEFSAIGDVGDIAAAVDPDSGLDPVERLIAASPFIGVGAVGARAAYQRTSAAFQAARAKEYMQQAQALRQATQEVGATMLPPEGGAYQIQDTDPITGDPVVRDPAKLASQQALTRKTITPAPEILAAETWQDVFRAIDPEAWNEPVAPGTLKDRFDGRRRVVANAVKGIGTAVVHMVPDPSIYGTDPEAREFTAAKIAVAKWQRAKELGITGFGYLSTPGLGSYSDRAIAEIIELEVATAGILDPALDMGTNARLGHVRQEANPLTANQRPTTLVYYGLVDEMLPTERVFDWTEGKPIDEARVRSRQTVMDYESFEGTGAANVLKAYEQMTPPSRIGGEYDQTQWYPAFNRTARVLAEETGFSVEQAAGVMSAMSASTPWVPDNLIGAIHVILQQGGQHKVGTPEYQKAFRRAIMEGGWGEDLAADVSEDLALAHGGYETPAGEVDRSEVDPEGLISHFSDPANVTSPEGNLIGAADQTKKDKIDLILKANMPPWIVLRGTKTTTFAALGTDPSIADLVTIDVWNDRVWSGSMWVPRPLAHEGYTTKTGIKEDAYYWDPVSKESITGKEVLGRLGTMKRVYNWTDAQVERWTGLLTAFPTERAQARYLAQARSHLIAADQVGMKGHEIQAGTWGVSRAWDTRESLQGALEAAQTPEEVRAIVDEAILDGVLFTHLEGNPAMEQTAAGKVWDVDDRLIGPTPDPDLLKKAKAGAQRPASGKINTSIIVEVRDGKAIPYADRSKPGVVETLRHTTPTGTKVGEYDRHIANKARTVASVLDHMDEVNEYRREDGRKAAGHVTINPDPTATQPGMIPGDRIVIIVPPDARNAVREVLNSEYPFDFTEAQVSQTRTGASRNKLHETHLRDLTSDQLQQVLLDNDWVAISASRSEYDGFENRRRNNEMRGKIRGMGGEVVEAKGRYPGEDGVVEEDSMLVTGLSYSQLLKLAKEYDQEAIATRYGMFNTDGTYHAVKDKVSFGGDVDADSHTQLSTGQRFSFDYDWDEALPYNEAEIDTFADADPETTPAVQVTVDMGGKFGGATWNVTDRLISRLSAIPGAKLRLYAHSPNKIPPSFKKATESVFTDTLATGTILHRNGDVYARHHADVWIPEHEMLTLSEDGFGSEGTQRSPEDVRQIMEIDSEAGTIRIDEDAEIVFDPNDEILVPETGPIFKNLRYKAADNDRLRDAKTFVVDTTGAIPRVVHDPAPAGEGMIVQPGLVRVLVEDGLVTRFQAHHDGDWADAKNVLTSLGLMPEGHHVRVEFPIAGPAAVNRLDRVAGPDVEPQKGLYTPSLELSHEAQPDMQLEIINRVELDEADTATTRMIQDYVPTLRHVRLGHNARPEVRIDIEDTIIGLHSEMGRYSSFTNRHGTVPVEIWLPDGTTFKEAGTIQVATHSTTGVDGYAWGGGSPFIVLSESVMMSRWNRGVQSTHKYSYRSPKKTDVESVLVHEIGHIIAGAASPGLADHATAMVFQQLHNQPTVIDEFVSPYGQTKNSEGWAEIFERVVFDEAAHPAMHDAVDLVLNDIRKNWGDDADALAMLARGGREWFESDQPT